MPDMLAAWRKIRAHMDKMMAVPLFQPRGGCSSSSEGSLWTVDSRSREM